MLAGADAEHVGQGLIPRAKGDVAQARPLARDPGASAQGLVDGAGSVADGGLDFLPLVVVQLGEVAARRAVQRRQAGEPAFPDLRSELPTVID